MGLMASVRALANGISVGAFFGGRGSGYEAGRHDVPELNGWAPGISAPDSHSWGEGETIVGRARDSDKNNAWINGALDRRTEAVIGKNIRLLAQPEYSALGQNFRWRAQWASKVESQFKIWANDVDRRNDARRRLNFGAMANLAYLHYVRDGEVGAEIRMTDRGSIFKTNVLLVDCDRLSNPDGKTNSPTLTNGVEKDESGAPVAYWVRKRHPHDLTGGLDINDWSRIPAYTRRTGRAKFVHVFNPRRIDQSRGTSRLAEAMVPLKMLDRVDRAEVDAALLSALMSFFIESPSSLSDLAPMIAPGGESSESEMWANYITEKKRNPLRIAGAVVRQLLPGEKVHAPQATRPNANYAAFQKLFLQKVSSSLGISYPQLSQDWAGINYSSARALLNEMWRSFMQDRDYFTQHFLTPIYAAWMEEAISLGLIEVPESIGGPLGFYRHKTALTMCEWLGPSRGSVDPLKEANANNLDIAAGRASTVEQILERNRSPVDLLDEEAAYQEMRSERGLNPQQLDIKTDSAGSEDGGGEGEGGTADDRDGDGKANEEEQDQAGDRRRRQNA
jgi:lambda family phage portal protein